jgi:RimJ/RimL family protein N-acetyltransferase
VTPPDLSFETPRVRARLLCEDDLDLYLALYTDPEVMRYIGPVMEREKAEDLFRLSLRHTRQMGVRALYWRVFSPSSGASIGLASLVRDAVHGASAEVGLMLPADERSAGIGQHCLSAMIGSCLSGLWPLGISEVCARHDEANVAARRLVESLDFTFVGSNPDRILSWRMSHGSWHSGRSGRMWSGWNAV